MDLERLYRVLIVDDDEVDRLAVIRGLTNSGLQVDTEEALNGAECLKLLDKSLFDCVFLDYRMGPGSNGLEVLQQVRGSGNYIPVVVMTGYGDERIAVDLMKAGATDYLPKSTLTPEVLGRGLRNAVALGESDERRRIAEQALHDSEKRFHTIFDAANDAILVINPTTDRITQANPRAIALLGYSVTELQDLAFNTVLPGEREVLAQLASNSLENAGSLTRESVCRSRQGVDIPVEISASLLPEPDQPTILTLIRDVTERKRFEEERKSALMKAMDSERLISVGEMAGGIAHELNQPLQSLTLTLYNLAREEEKKQLKQPILSSKMKKLQQLVDDISNIVKNLAGYARPDDEYGEHLLKDIVDSALTISGRQLKHLNINVELDIPAGFTIWGRRNAIIQALLNLLANARDAYQRQADSQPDAQRPIVVSAGAEGGYDHIYVRDEAGGIPAEIRNRVFEPFVSTKSALKGTGMGLHIVSRIIADHQGQVRFEVDDGIGTRFELILPQKNQETSNATHTDMEPVTEET